MQAAGQCQGGMKLEGKPYSLLWFCWAIADFIRLVHPSEFEFRTAEFQFRTIPGFASKPRAS